MGAHKMISMIAAFFAAAYLPFALTNAYTPVALGVMSRTHGLGVWAGALAAAWILRRKQWALAGLLAFCGWHSFQGTRDWAASWRLQREIVAQVAPCAAALPPGGHLLIDTPLHVGVADIFTSWWDLSRALRFATGRPDIEASVVTEGGARQVHALLAAGRELHDAGGHVYTNANTRVFDWGKKECLTP